MKNYKLHFKSSRTITQLERIIPNRGIKPINLEGIIPKIKH